MTNKCARLKVCKRRDDLHDQASYHVVALKTRAGTPRWPQLDPIVPELPPSLSSLLNNDTFPLL